MADEIKRPGYLRYRSDCGAFVKIDYDDPETELAFLLASGQRTIPHKCDPLRMCVATLIGSTLSDDSAKYCSPITK